MLSSRGKRIVAGIVLFFVLYSIYTSPEKSAEVVHSVWSIICTAIVQIFTFFDQIIG